MNELPHLTTRHVRHQILRRGVWLVCFCAALLLPGAVLGRGENRKAAVNLATLVPSLRRNLQKADREDVNQDGTHLYFIDKATGNRALYAIMITTAAEPEAEVAFRRRLWSISIPPGNEIPGLGDDNRSLLRPKGGGQLFFRRWNCLITLSSPESDAEWVIALAKDIDKALQTESSDVKHVDQVAPVPFSVPNPPIRVEAGARVRFAITLPDELVQRATAGLGARDGSGYVFLENGAYWAEYLAPRSSPSDEVQVYVTIPGYSFTSTNISIRILPADIHNKDGQLQRPQNP